MEDERHSQPVEDRPQELKDKLQDVHESDPGKSGGDDAPPFNPRDAQQQEAERS